MNAVAPKELFTQSLERCLKHKEYIPSFYKRFMSSSDEVREKFRTTDFDRQNLMLVRSLKLAARATDGEQEALQELKDRARSHDRYHLNIKPELYELWLTSILETSKEFDEKWNEEIEDAWNSILGYVIKYMIRRY